MSAIFVYFPVNADCSANGDNGENCYLDLGPYRRRLREYCVRAGLELDGVDVSGNEDFDMSYYKERLKTICASRGLDINLDAEPELNFANNNSRVKCQEQNLDGQQANSISSDNSSEEGGVSRCLFVLILMWNAVSFMTLFVEMSDILCAHIPMPVAIQSSKGHTKTSTKYGP